MRLVAVFMTLMALFTGGCLGSDSLEAALGEEFELAPNQSSRIAGTELTVAFRRVQGDSRCPVDSLCLVEGGAGIDLEVFGGSNPGQVILTTPPPSTWTDGTYQVKVVDLRPHPTSGTVIQPEDYRVRLVVDLAPR